MALRLQQVMITASARTGKVLIHFLEVYLGKIYIAHWSAVKGDPAARTERDTRHTGHNPLLPSACKQFHNTAAWWKIPSLSLLLCSHFYLLAHQSVNLPNKTDCEAAQ